MLGYMKSRLIFVATTVFFPITSYAAGDPCASSSGTELCKTTFLGIPTHTFLYIVKLIISTLGFIAGVLAVVFIIMGGINLATSEGDPSKVANARKTISFAIIGLIIAILAPLIVSFVVSRGPQ